LVNTKKKSFQQRQEPKMSILCYLTTTFVYYGFLASVFAAVCIALLFTWYWKVRSFPGTIESHFEIKNEKMAKWRKEKIPIYYLHEAYINQEVDVKGDLLKVLEEREKFSTFTVTPENMKFFFLNVVPEFFVHSKSQDRAQICDHYNRGNEFFHWFLGDAMTYTSGIYHQSGLNGTKKTDLYQAQVNKMNKVAARLHLKEGEELLDIGCGWGTWIRYAAKTFGVKATGVTISKEQVKWHKQKVIEEESKDANMMCMDYREIPKNKKYDKISCLEMSEHVGVWKYKSFVRQVYNLLKDDGLFYLQIAGLRMTCYFEDICWAFFMDKYIFPGADASLPLTFPIFMLETGGFEINSVQTIGVHYGLTLHAWYDLWVSNKAKILKDPKYGVRWYRLWEWFLAWSAIIAKQGTSACFMIIAHKNLNTQVRYQWVTPTQI